MGRSTLHALTTVVALVGSACSLLLDTGGFSDPQANAPSPTPNADGGGGGVTDAKTPIAVDPNDGAPPSSPEDAAAPTNHGCPGARFIDRFDDNDLLTPFWSSPTTTGGSLAMESNALKVLVPPAAGTRMAYLRFNRGPAPAIWSFCFSTSLRIRTPTVGFVQGPRIVSSREKESTMIYIGIKERALFLSQYGDLCGDGTVGCALDIDIDDRIGTLTDAWAKITIKGRVDAKTTAPFGTIEVTVDHQPTTSIPLAVKLSGEPFTNLRLGMTRAYANEGGELFYDDVEYTDTLP